MTSKRRGRPIDDDKRQAILIAARGLCFQHGYAGLRLDDVAMAAGVSKMTIYNAYGDKESLFEAVVRMTSDRMEEALRDVSLADAPVEHAMQTFGEDLLAHVFHDDFVRFDIVMLGQTETPEVLRLRFYDGGPGRVLNTMADYLATRVGRGELQIDDTHQAAEDLVSLWMGQWQMRRRYGKVEPATPEEMSRRVAHGIRVFLHAYGVKS